jgi:hypothetical protein
MPSVRLAALLVLAVGCFADNPPGPPEAGSGGPSTSTTGGSTGAPTTGEACPPDMPDRPWYLDQDGDGWGAGDPVLACGQPIGHVDRAGDCDDFKIDTNPGAAELCNDADDDCDGVRDEFSAKNPVCGACGLAERAGAPYWFCKGDGSDWLKAREACQARGSGVDLASVHSAEDDQWIADNLGLLGFAVDPAATVWLGLRRPDDVAATCDVVDQWIWTDGTPYDFKAWGPGQPDNNPTMGGCDPNCSFDQLGDADCPRENCLDLAGIDGWNDVPCGLAGQGYICRGPAPGDMS